MNDFFKFKGIDKAFRFGLAYLKWWYIALIIVAILGIAGTIYVAISYPDNAKKSIMFFNSVFVLLVSFLYLKISLSLTEVVKGNTLKCLKRLGGYFFILFFLDLVSLLRGGFHNKEREAAKIFLEILPQDSTIYTIYSKIYLYLPSAYDFLLPKMEGTALLLTSITLFALSKKAEN